jgi:hypothetical protein
MWSTRSEKLAKHGAMRFVVERDARPVPYSQVIAALRDDESFRAFLTRTLAEVPYSAFRWETPGVAQSSVEKPFEFVVLDEPSLARRVDEQAFAEHFTQPDAAAISFANLGRNAILIVPTLQVEADAYGHLAAFVRRAPAAQHDALWRLVGEEMTKRLSTWPAWLSTAGAGVAWLHVRLDDRPKYYGYQPYARQT